MGELVGKGSGPADPPGGGGKGGEPADSMAGNGAMGCTRRGKSVSPQIKGERAAAQSVADGWRGT